MKKTTFIVLATLLIVVSGFGIVLFSPELMDSKTFYLNFPWIAGLGYLVILFLVNPPTRSKLRAARENFFYAIKKRRGMIRSVMTNWHLMIGLVLLLGILYLTVFIPLPVDEGQMNIFTQSIALIRNTLKIGLLASVVSISLGTILGLFAGYLEGWLGKVINFFSDMILIVPFYLLAILMLMRTGQSFQNIIFIIAIYGMIKTVKLVQAQVLVYKEMEFVTAALAIGQNQMGVMFKAILPVLSPILYTQFLTLVATNITIEATLGLIGIVPNSIGRLIVGKLNGLIYQSDWGFVTPVGILILTIFAFLLIGQGLQRMKLKA